MYKIMIVEDDRGIAEAIKTQASVWNLEAVCVEDFRNVTALFANEKPHLILLDISLPFYNGYYWCEEIRKISSVPVIFISSASDNMNIIMAMNMGADDFIAKPFDSSVLIAKIRALLRRTYDFSDSLPVIEHNGLILSTSDSFFTFNGVRTELSKNEYRILLELMENRGKVVSRDKIMERLWESEDFIDENTLSVNVGRLRRKLEDAGLKDFIKTKFGVGYIV